MKSLEVKIIKVKELDFTKVAYYTLRFENDSKTELEKFYENYQEDYSRSIYYIKMWIAQIGEKFGAEKRWFRPEDNAAALPPPAQELKCLDIDIENENLKLRLYCIVLTHEIVILVNGGIKESNSTAGSPTCWPHYLFASNMASQLHKMIKDNNLTIKDKVLKKGKKFKLIYNKK